ISTGAPLHSKPTRSDITVSDRQDRGMATPPLSRPALLAASGVVRPAGAGGGSAAAAPMGDKKKLSALLLASDLYASPDPQRIVFALAEGPKYASGPAAQLAYGQSRKLRASA